MQMTEAQSGRQLTVIAFTDLKGYSALTESNEALALELLDIHLAMVRKQLVRYGGIEIKTIGDAFLLEFSSALNAVRCLVAVQDAHREYNQAAGKEREIHMRAGIHLGDVERRGGDIFGSGVNIAARLEPQAPVDGIAISEQVHFQIRQSAEFDFRSVGNPTLKNIGDSMEVFIWCRDEARLASLVAAARKARPGGAARPVTFLSELLRRRVIQTLLLYIGSVWLLQKGADALTASAGLPSWVPVLAGVLLLAGVPVVAWLAWFFEFSPQGIRRTVSPPGGRRAYYNALPLIGLMVVASMSVGMGYYQYVAQRNTQSKSAEGIGKLTLGQTIAVMPFRDQSPDQDQAFFAEGLAEELTSLLGQIPGLQVAASTSSFILAKRGLGPVDIGKQLGVAAVIDGSIRVSGDRLKIRVELINPVDGKTLWTESFSRQLADIFDVESEIARSIANLLQDRFLEAGSVASQARTASTDAYVLYLKGREQYRLQTTEAMKEARKLFEQAVGLDPEYAQAYVGVADSLVLLADGRSRLGVMDPDIAARLASESLAKALVRAPQLADAYAIQGKVFELQNEEDNALAAYEKAIALNPSLAIAHMWRYQALGRQARFREAMESLERAFVLDPISVTTMFNRALELSRRGRFDASRAQFEQLIKQFPESPMGHQGLADAAYQVGELALSLKHWKAAHDISPDNANFLHSYIGVMLSMGMIAEARPLATDKAFKATLLLIDGKYPALFKEMDFQLAAHPDDPNVAFEAGWYQALVGDKARAIKLLLQAHKAISEPEQLTMPMCSPAIEFAWALKRAGRNNDATALANKCKALVTAARGSEIVNNDHTYLAARIAALAGETDTAVAELTKAVDAGWREWWSARDPLLESLHGLAPAQAQFARIESALASEREMARAEMSGGGAAVGAK